MQLLLREERGLQSSGAGGGCFRSYCCRGESGSGDIGLEGRRRTLQERKLVFAVERKLRTEDVLERGCWVHFFGVSIFRYVSTYLHYSLVVCSPLLIAGYHLVICVWLLYGYSFCSLYFHWILYD